MSPWADFYRGRVGEDYLDYCKDRYAPFLDAVQMAMLKVWTHRHIKVVEIGCGLATMSKLLSRQNPAAEFIATDRCEEMLRLAEQGRGLVRLQPWQASKPFAGADVVHSHGLLEHFTDEQIILTIGANPDAAQVHYVPGKYKTPSFGDERLMDVDSWWLICRPDQILTFNGGLDYALIFEPRR